MKHLISGLLAALTLLFPLLARATSDGVSPGQILIGQSITLLGGKNSLWFTEQIYTQFITRFNWEQGAAFGFLLLALSTAMVWVGLKLSGQHFGEVMRR